LILHERHADDLQYSAAPVSKFDPDECAALLGLTHKQRKAADAFLRGANKTKSAEAAGYSGTGPNLRATASKIFASKNVKQYIALAQSGGAGVPDAPADRDELKKVLSRLLRGTDKPTQIRAAEVLHRLSLAEAEEAAARNMPDPREVLNQIAQSSLCFSDIL
jgi:hypothetical protein